MCCLLGYDIVSTGIISGCHNDNKKTTRVPVLSHQTTWVKTYHLSAKREVDEFFTWGSLVNENSNEGGFLFIMNLKI